MDLTPHVEELRHHLESGAAPESAAWLVLLDAISAAAAEITLELAPGSVDVRLRGRNPEFVVIAAQPATGPTGPTEPSPPPAPVADGDDSGTSRITLRLPEQLKARIEEAAGRDGISVNSWLVRTISAAVGAAPDPSRNTVRSSPTGGESFTGWAR